MSRPAPRVEALVALQVAALRGAGWPTSRAVEHLAAALGAVPMGVELRRVAAALARGERPEDPDDSSLLALLARGDAAGPDSLRAAARSALDRHRAAERARGLVLPVAGALAALLGLLAWMGWAVEWTQLKETLEGRLPAATRVALGLLEVLRWTGLPLALLLWAAARRLPARWVPGGAELSCAAGLRERSAQLRAGIALSPAQALMPTSSVLTRWERRYASALAERLGPTFAVDSVAQALEVGAERRRLLWWTLLPLGVLLLLVVFVLPLLLALYLPIFSIAGAIK